MLDRDSVTRSYDKTETIDTFLKCFALSIAARLHPNKSCLRSSSLQTQRAYLIPPFRLFSLMLSLPHSVTVGFKQGCIHDSFLPLATPSLLMIIGWQLTFLVGEQLNNN